MQSSAYLRSGNHPYLSSWTIDSDSKLAIELVREEYAFLSKGLPGSVTSHDVVDDAVFALIVLDLL